MTVAVLFQDGGLMTFRTAFTRKAQIAEARGLLEGANKGIKKGGKLATLVEVEIKITGEIA